MKITGRVVHGSKEDERKTYKTYIYRMHSRSSLDIWSRRKREYRVSQQYPKKGSWRRRDGLLRDRRGQTLWLGEKWSQDHGSEYLSHWTQKTLSPGDARALSSVKICCSTKAPCQLDHRRDMPSPLWVSFSGHGHQLWCATAIPALWSLKQFSPQHAPHLQHSCPLRAQKEHAAIDSITLPAAEAS